MRIKEIGFEWESKFRNQAHESMITERLGEIVKRHPFVYKTWHRDGQNIEFITMPRPYAVYQFDQFRDIQKTFKETYEDYKLKSLHLHVSINVTPQFREPINPLFRRLWDSIIPIAWMVRMKKQTSLMDARTQAYHPRKIWEKQLITCHPYPEHKVGFELRFGGRYWREYIPIVKSIDKALNSINYRHPHLSDHPDGEKILKTAYFGYPTGIKTMFNTSQLGLRTIFNQSTRKDPQYFLAKRLYREIEIRKRSSMPLGTLAFLFILPMYRNYFPKTVEYVEEVVIPNFSEMLVEEIKYLRRDKYKFPILRAWKNILQDIGSKGYRELDTAYKALAELKSFSPLPTESKELPGSSLCMNVFGVVPATQIEIDGKKIEDAIKGIQWQKRCPAIKTRDKNLRLDYNCSVYCEGRKYIVCCLDCERSHPDIGCPYICTRDDPRHLRVLLRSRWVTRMYPKGIYFTPCHDCMEDCSLCKCLECRWIDGSNPKKCSDCMLTSNIIDKIGHLYMTSMFQYMRPVATVDLWNVAGIMAQCENLVIHEEFMFVQCKSNNRCSRQTCCYLCNLRGNCNYTCTRLGASSANTSKNMPAVYNPKLPKDIKIQILDQYKRGDDIYDRIPRIMERLKRMMKKVEMRQMLQNICGYECLNNLDEVPATECDECPILNPERCLICIKNMYRWSDQILCKECEFIKTQRYWVYYNHRLNMFVAHKNDDKMMKMFKDKVAGDTTVPTLSDYIPDGAANEECAECEWEGTDECTSDCVYYPGVH